MRLLCRARCRQRLQATPAPAERAAEENVAKEVPLTDVSPNSLVDVATPLESQEDVQHTLEAEQKHAAVYSPGPDAIPEQTPDQIAAVRQSLSSAAQSKGLGMGQSPSKHAKQQLANGKPGKQTVSRTAPLSATHLLYIDMFVCIKM